MTRAFVLSGGGSLGAVQVGMLQAMGEVGVTPDFLVGTSVGAVNAAWVASHGMSRESLDDLARVWRGLRRRDIFPLDPQRIAQAAVGRKAALCSADRLGHLVHLHTRGRDLSALPIPVHLLATDLLSGEAVLVSEGAASEAVRASTALPGIFPPVTIGSRHLIDGGVALQSGVVHALGLGATEIYVLPAGVSCALARPPRSALGVAMHCLTLLIAQRVFTEVSLVTQRSGASVHVLPPLCPLGVSSMDFSHGAELLSRSYRAATEWLAAGGHLRPHQERFLTLHDHPAAQPTPSPMSVPSSASASA